MSQIQIPNLGAAVGIDGTELMEVVQSGTSKRVTIGQIVTLSIGISTGGSTGQILIGNTGGAPSWSSTPTISGTLRVGSTVAASATLDVTGTFAASTSATTPTIYGGSAVNSTLTLQSTSATTPTSDVILFKTGNNFERMRIDTNGSVGIGSSSITGYNLRISKNITGSLFSYGAASDGVVQSDVTSLGYGFYSAIGTAAATFTLTEIRQFSAAQGTFGAGSTVSSSKGFSASSGLIGATTNFSYYSGDTAAVTAGKTSYGFYSDANTASGGGTTWAFFGNGTANNAFRGNVRIGGLTAPVSTLDVTGTVTVSSSVSITGLTAWASIYANASGTLLSTAAGTTGQPLLANTSTGPAFGALSIGTANTNVTGALTVTNGGTGVATLTLNGVLYGNGTTGLLVTAQGAANTILTANAGAPSFSATPTIGTSVTVPLVVGGSAVSSTLTLQSTSGAGITDSVIVKVGNAGAVTAATFNTAGAALSVNWYNTTTQTATNTATLTAAQITSPFLLGTPTATASYTLPLASAVETALGTPATGAGWEFIVFTTAAFAITLLTNTGWTLVGSMATGATANSFARFRAAKTGAAAYSLYRIS